MELILDGFILMASFWMICIGICAFKKSRREK